jgi:hypothetical protein
MPDTPRMVSTKNKSSRCGNIAERAFQSLAARRASFLIWYAGRASGPTRAKGSNRMHCDLSSSSAKALGHSCSHLWIIAEKGLTPQREQRERLGTIMPSGQPPAKRERTVSPYTRSWQMNCHSLRGIGSNCSKSF